jgi:hypothetical protein
MRLIKKSVLLALAVLAVTTTSYADGRNSLSPRARKEVRQQIDEIRNQLAKADAESDSRAARADETRICITRAKDSCADGNNCDEGRECRKNTAMIRVTDCACYDKKKTSISVGGALSEY